MAHSTCCVRPVNGSQQAVCSAQQAPDLLCAEMDPLDLFGNVGYHRPCDLVFVNGKLTVRAGQILTVDEGRLYREGRREIERLLG